jgi:ribose 1,5-bisphosphokinase
MRARKSDGALERRLQRIVTDTAKPDRTIVNVGSAQFHARQLVQIIRGTRRMNRDLGRKR